MSEPEHFEWVGDYAVYRPAGRFSLDQAVKLITSAIAHSREQGIQRLLINTCGFSGFEPPSTLDRYFFVKEWARTAGGKVEVAMVARLEMIDPRRFGVMVATVSGWVADVFLSEDEALVWLLGSKRKEG